MSHGHPYRTYIHIKRHCKEEFIYHLPVMTLISYLCSIGGIMSMWIGISVISEGKRIIAFNMRKQITIEIYRS